MSPEPPTQNCGEAGDAQPGQGKQALVCLFQFFSDVFPPQYTQAAEGFTGALWNGCLPWLWDLKKKMLSFASIFISSPKFAGPSAVPTPVSVPDPGVQPTPCLKVSVSTAHTPPPSLQWLLHLLGPLSLKKEFHSPRRPNLKPSSHISFYAGS